MLQKKEKKISFFFVEFKRPCMLLQKLINSNYIFEYYYEMTSFKVSFSFVLVLLVGYFEFSKGLPMSNEGKKKFINKKV